MKSLWFCHKKSCFGVKENPQQKQGQRFPSTLIILILHLFFYYFALVSWHIVYSFHKYKCYSTFRLLAPSRYGLLHFRCHVFGKWRKQTQGSGASFVNATWTKQVWIYLKKKLHGKICTTLRQVCTLQTFWKRGAWAFSEDPMHSCISEPQLKLIWQHKNNSHHLLQSGSVIIEQRKQVSYMAFM